MPKHTSVSWSPVAYSDHPARGKDLPELPVEARHMSLVPDLVHGLHCDHRGVGRLKSLSPVRTLEVRVDELRLRKAAYPVTAQPQHMFRKIEKRIARDVRAVLKDALGQEPWTRPSSRTRAFGGSVAMSSANRRRMGTRQGLSSSQAATQV